MDIEKIKNSKVGMLFRRFFLIIKYGLSSLTAFLIDMGFFTLFVALFEKWEIINYVAVATLAARVISCTYNFFINRNFVFKKRQKTASSSAKFAVLCVFVACVSAFTTNFLTKKMGIYPVYIKLVVDMLLFFFNFFVQKVWVFK